MNELIKRWNEFCEEKQREEIIHQNNGLEDIIEQVYGEDLTLATAADIACSFCNGTYQNGCGWWWIDSAGNFHGAYTTNALPIDLYELNAWCKSRGYGTPWTREK